MKKLISIALLAALVCSLFSGCFACDHDWEDATCEEPKTCSECGETRGDPIDHKPGDPQTSDYDVIEGTYYVETPCKFCGEIIDSGTEKYTSFVLDGKVILTPMDVLNRLDNGFDKINGCTLSTKMDTTEGNLIAVISSSGYSSSMVAGMMFTGDDGKTMTDRNHSGISAMLVMCFDDDYFTYVLLATILALDPDSTFEEAKETAMAVLDAAKTNTSYTHENLKYTLGKSNGNYTLSIQVVE